MSWPGETVPFPAAAPCPTPPASAALLRSALQGASQSLPIFLYSQGRQGLLKAGQNETLLCWVVVARGTTLALLGAEGCPR